VRHQDSVGVDFFLAKLAGALWRAVRHSQRRAAAARRACAARILSRCRARSLPLSKTRSRRRSARVVMHPLSRAALSSPRFRRRPFEPNSGTAASHGAAKARWARLCFVHIDIHGTAHPIFLTPSAQWQRGARLGQYQLTVDMRNVRRTTSPFCSDNDSSARRRRSRCSSVGAGCNNAQQSNRAPSRGAPSAATDVPALVLIAEERAWTSFYCDS
jgi:hypothetical protein